MFKRTHIALALVALLTLAFQASAHLYWHLPPGQRMEAESWEQLPAGAVVADKLASGDKAVLLKRGGEGMAKTFPLKRSYYALSVWLRAAQENTYLPPAYLELTIGEKTYRIRVRYNMDRKVYLPGYPTNFIIDKHAGYDVKGDFAKAKRYLPNPYAKKYWRAENTRFYFPVDADGDYTLTLKMGARSKVDFLVDRLELRDVLAHLPAGPTKKRRVLFSLEEEKEWARARERDPRAKALAEETRKRAVGFVQWPDERIWDYVPDPCMPRSQVAGPCPVHGNEVYRRGGRANPWRGHAKPFHVTCLVGNEVYPSNEYEKGDMTSGKYPDDGWGYHNAESKSPYSDDRETLFVARRVYNRWQGLTADPERMARAYIVTGDPKIAHKAGVMLAKIAYHYPGYDYRFQARATICGHSHGGISGIDRRMIETFTPNISTYNGWACGKIFYSGWTGGHFELRMMKAYDLLFPALMKDEALLKFVGSKIAWVKTFGDLQELYDRYLLATYADALIRRQARSANSGWEGSAVTMGAIQDGPMAKRTLDELFTHAHLDGANAGGFGDAVVNMLSRNGVGLIYSPMYMFGWTQGLNAAADILPRIADEQLRERYGKAGGTVGRRIDAMAEFAKNIRLAGEFLPNIGDTNRACAHTADHFLRDVWPMWLPRWRRYRNPCDAALVMRFARRDELLVGHAGDLELLEADAKKAHNDLQQPSRVMGGYGAVVLESGLGQPDRAKKGALFMPFGAGWGHSHRDTLNLELFSQGYRVLPDKGRHHGPTVYHNVVLVDGRSHAEWVQGNRFGWLNHFAAAPGVRFADAGARPHRYAELDRYRRAVAYVDAPGGNQYVFDVFQVKGGSRHELGLHGPPATNFTSSLALGPPRDQANALYKGKFKYLRQGAAKIAGPVTLDWKFLFGTNRAAPKETDVHMHATVWGAEGGQLLAADVTGDIPYDITGAHFHREGKDLFSNFVTLMDPYDKAPFVKSSQRLPVKGKDSERAAALEVVMADGRRDVLVYNGGPAGRDTQLARLPESTLDVPVSFRTDGVFGLVSRDAAGTVLSAMLVAGTRLQAKDLVVEAEVPEYRCSVASVDRTTGEIALDKPLPAGVNLAGATVVIGSPTRSRAYQVTSVSADGRRLQVKGALLIFQSKIESVDEAAGTVRVQYPFYKCKCDPKFYDGCVVTNEARTAFWRIREVRRDDEKQAWQHAPTAVLAPLAAAGKKGFATPTGLRRDLFTDEDGDGRALLCVYEIAPGDTLRLTTWVHAARAADGRYTVRANVACRVK